MSCLIDLSAHYPAFRLLNDCSQIPENNLRAIEILRKRNIHFVISSGRSYLSLDYFANSLSLKTPGNFGIAFNGCTVYRLASYEILSNNLLENKIMKWIMNELQPFSEVDKFVYDKNATLLSTVNSDGFKDYVAFVRSPHRLIGDFHILNEDVCKILLKGSSVCLQEVHDAMLPKIQGKCNMFFSGRHLLEFTALEATKGKALKFLASYLNLDLTEIIAIGDNYNDISMLQAAGTGVAVANAVDNLKAAASFVTLASNNDGAILEVVNNLIG